MADETFKGLEASINEVLRQVTEQSEVKKSLSKKIDIFVWVERVAANHSSPAQSINELCSLET